MEFVHKHGLIHCDLKPTSILLDKQKHVKICDFSMATLIPSETSTTSQISSFAGIRGFIAPELFQGRKYNEKVDVYSFGIVMNFILTRGEIPVDFVDAVSLSLLFSILIVLLASQKGNNRLYNSLFRLNPP